MKKVALPRRALRLLGRVLLVTLRSFAGVFCGTWQ